MMPVVMPPTSYALPSPSALSALMSASPNADASSSPRGRKRTNESMDEHNFSKHSHSDFSDDDSCTPPRKGSPGVDDERRAHHNELERRRRDHIKDHFMALKDCIPLLEGEKSSRALILKRAVDYICDLQRKNEASAACIDDLKRKYEQLSSGLIEKATSPVAVAPAATPEAPATTAIATSLLNIPTTSAGSVTVPISFDYSKPALAPAASSFSPVLPQKTLSFPPTATPVEQLAMLLALNQKSSDPLASLLSFNQLALKEIPPPVSSAHYVTPVTLF